MKQIPIIFSSEMVRALLNGTKTQTRRIVKPQPELNGSGLYKWSKKKVALQTDEEGLKDKVLGVPAWANYQPGDLLYVRETWIEACLSEDGEGPVDGDSWKYYYKADDEWTNHDWHHPDKDGPQDGPRWRPSIHLPKEASRIWLRVTDVSVERLQDISEADALAEGVDRTKCNGDWECPPSEVFMELWTRINGKESTAANPFVWKITFEVVSTTGIAGINEKKLVTV